MKRLLTVFAFLATTLCTTAYAETSGAWNSQEIKGFKRYWTVNSTGGSVTIWCHPDRISRGTLISIDIEGRRPDPETLVRIELDRKLIKFHADSEGYIQTACATCSDNFDYFWHQLRSSAQFRVLFEDERYAGFSLRGARRILPGDVCPTDWVKRHTR